MTCASGFFFSLLLVLIPNRSSSLFGFEPSFLPSSRLLAHARRADLRTRTLDPYTLGSSTCKTAAYPSAVFSRALSGHSAYIPCCGETPPPAAYVYGSTEDLKRRNQLFHQMNREGNSRDFSCVGKVPECFQLSALGSPKPQHSTALRSVMLTEKRQFSQHHTENSFSARRPGVPSLHTQAVYALARGCGLPYTLRQQHDRIPCLPGSRVVLRLPVAPPGRGRLIVRSCCTSSNCLPYCSSSLPSSWPPSECATYDLDGKKVPEGEILQVSLSLQHSFVNLPAPRLAVTRLSFHSARSNPSIGCPAYPYGTASRLFASRPKPKAEKRARNFQRAYMEQRKRAVREEQIRVQMQRQLLAQQQEQHDKMKEEQRLRRERAREARENTHVSAANDNANEPGPGTRSSAAAVGSRTLTQLMQQSLLLSGEPVKHRENWVIVGSTQRRARRKDQQKFCHQRAFVQSVFPHLSEAEREEEVLKAERSWRGDMMLDELEEQLGGPDALAPSGGGV